MTGIENFSACDPDEVICDTIDSSEEAHFERSIREIIDNPAYQFLPPERRLSIVAQVLESISKDKS